MEEKYFKEIRFEKYNLFGRPPVSYSIKLGVIIKWFK